MIIDITNEILTEIDTLLDGIEVLTSYPEEEFNGNVVTVEEISNVTNDNTIDSAGEQTNIVSLEINIYTSSPSKMTQAKEIRNQIDELLSGKYKMNRDIGRPTPNLFDNSIYKYTLRYSFIIDKNKTIYRR